MKRKRKKLANLGNIGYNNQCCDMIAMKREVAALGVAMFGQVFRGANVKLENWRQVTVPFILQSMIAR